MLGGSLLLGPVWTTGVMITSSDKLGKTKKKVSFSVISILVIVVLLYSSMPSLVISQMFEPKKEEPPKPIAGQGPRRGKLASMVGTCCVNIQ